MSDDAMLRLAELVAHLTCDVYANGDDRIARAAQLVRDLEAAPTTHTMPDGIAWNPAMAPRTITREEYGSGIEVLVRIGTVHKRDVDELLSRWRLTVEG